VAQFDDDLRRRFDGLEEALRARMRTDGLAVVEQRARGRRRRRRGAVVLAVAAVAAVAALADTGLFPLAQRDPQPLTPVPPITTTAASVNNQVLTPGGLAGIATFGEPQDRVEARLRNRFGAPNEDHTWNQSVRQYFGACPGDQHRFLRWGRLFALFTNGVTSHRRAGGWHFFAWYAEDHQVTGSLDPATTAGIRVGSTVADLRRAYGSSVRIFGAQASDGFVIIGGGGINGALSNTSKSGRVTQLSAGEVCGE
jgi:hypothetical protein